MSPNVIRRVLWLVLLVALPVPYWVFEPGRVPTLWLAELSAFVLAMLLTEGGMVTQIVATLFAAQTLLFVGVTWLIARFAARVLTRLPERRRASVALATAALVLGASLLPLYRSPLVADGAPVNLVGLFQ
jgi:hypothetical protein